MFKLNQLQLAHRNSNFSPLEQVCFSILLIAGDTYQHIQIIFWVSHTSKQYICRGCVCLNSYPALVVGASQRLDIILLHFCIMLIISVFSNIFTFDCCKQSSTGMYCLQIGWSQYLVFVVIPPFEIFWSVSLYYPACVGSIKSLQISKSH